MKDEYRIGSELDWLKHSNEELATLVKKREKQVRRWRSFSVFLLLVLVWVIYRFAQYQPLNHLL